MAMLFCRTAGTVRRFLHTPRALVYARYGAPQEELTLKEIPEADLALKSDDDVLVKFLAAPINPADINQIQGVYPVKPSLPAVGGNEGVAQVLKVNKGTLVKPGDWVIPSHSGAGTWRTHAVFNGTQLQVLPPNISLTFASTVSVNACTAYQMLKAFEQLKPGDVVIQNAANSGVGMAVIQIAHSLGLNTVNVVRSRPNQDELARELKSRGATVVITEEELAATPKIIQLFKDSKWDMPKLALNAVGGKNATDLARLLRHSGTMVTYGAMSKQPVTVPNALLIFKDIKLRGFWMTKWNETSAREQRLQMLEDLAQLHRQGKFDLPTKAWHLDDFREALSAAQTPYTQTKQMFKFE